MSDQIAIIETYRGVRIHDAQSVERIEGTVKHAIDAVFAMSDPAKLLQYALDVRHVPEARLLAQAKVEATIEMAAADRVTRPSIDVNLVRAACPGLASRRCRSPSGYGSIFDVPPAPGQLGHDPRPVEYQHQVEEDAERATREEPGAMSSE